jgi:hypothetical protein
MNMSNFFKEKQGCVPQWQAGFLGIKMCRTGLLVKHRSKELEASL